MLTNEELSILKKKIEKAFPIRVKLAKLAGVVYKDLLEFDNTIPELYLKIVLEAPDKAEEALKLIKSIQ